MLHHACQDRGENKAQGQKAQYNVAEVGGEQRRAEW